MAVAVAPAEVRPPSPPIADRARPSVWVWLVAAAFAPLVVAYYWRLWDLPHYQFFPLALGGAYLLARRDRDASLAPGRVVDRRAVAPLLVVALGILAVAVVLDSPWLAVPGVLFAGAAYAVDRGGRSELRRLVPAALMILITLRPPMGFDDRLIRLLQQFTARAASGALDVLGVLHVLSGNVIEIPGRRLMVEEACSGVNSFFSATACVLFYVLWNRRGWISSLLLFLSIPFWVVFANTLRVVSVTVLRAKWDIAADEGWLHDALGLGVFLLAVGLIVSTERFLRFYAALLESDRRPSPTAAAAAAPVVKNSSSVAGSRRWRIAGVVALLLLMLQTPSLFGRVSDVASQWSTPQLATFGESFVPEQFGGWRRAKFETVERDRNSPFGRTSQSWSLAAPGINGVLSLDYPFAGWHELTECYEAQGWRVENREIAVDPAHPTAAAVHVVFRHDQTKRYGQLWFALVTPTGEPVAVRTRGEFDEWRDRAARRLRDLLHFRIGSDAVELEHRKTYQVQLFTETYSPATEEQTAASEAAFGEFRSRVIAALQASPT